mmetsp:Transcript_88698/g.284760  ORF Transcript_88698/g.284760 Transcript_88698/m.284760 type:complete len:85 (+) Transcript_88698:243-497(+)
MAPLDLFGCTEPSQGVEPNGYGGWWMGRNGWCNGQNVKPWVVDVTSAVLGLEDYKNVSTEYRGLLCDVKAQCVAVGRSLIGRAR